MLQALPPEDGDDAVNEKIDELNNLDASTALLDLEDTLSIVQAVVSTAVAPVVEVCMLFL